MFPRPPAPISYAPYVAGGWLCVGLAWLAWLRARPPEKVAQVGSMLAEGRAPPGAASIPGGWKA